MTYLCINNCVICYNIKLGFATISNNDYDYKTWFWIPSEKVSDEDIQFKNNKYKNNYLIPMEVFERVSDKASLEKVFE
ncbi:hypothetical protein HYW20_09205 [Candidatus Woesearchaeota archaeon]|nr:hypothetical protein [Candidatus Woesearchaeota archaeon]